MAHSLYPTTPFILHILIEIPASLNFFLNPLSQLLPPVSTSSCATSGSISASEDQLSSSATPARGEGLSATAPYVIRQYAVLLLASTLIAGSFVGREVDGLSRRIASILSLYHFTASLRGATRIYEGESVFGDSLGGPGLHLLVHGICFFALLGLGLGVWDDGMAERGQKAERKTD